MEKLKILTLLICCALITLACGSSNNNKEATSNSNQTEHPAPTQHTIQQSELILTAEDKTIFEQKMTDYKHTRAETSGELITEIAHSFIGTPYVEKTLEVDPSEKLVLNLHQFDCTTFVESCIALTLTAQSEDHSLGHYALALENLRYRDGQRDGYASRLHYFSEWITNNEQKKIIDNVSQQVKGDPFPVQLSFMSEHANLYPMLSGQDSLIQIIENAEKKISEHKFYFIPEDKLRMVEPLLFDGDIVAITTNTKGLDVSHTGFVFRKNDRVHLLHASSAKKQVVVSQVPLVDYLKKSKSTTGIMVLRMR